MKNILNMKLEAVLLGLALTAAACNSSQPPQAVKPAPASPAAAPVAANIPPPSPWAAAKGGDVWLSETTHKEYRVRIDGKRFYAEWTNLSPVAARNRAYIHTECDRKGSKWIGTSDIFLPCTEGEGQKEHVANTCHLRMKIEIDSISKNLIKGRGQTLHKFDCGSCKVEETGWMDFEWVPKK